MELFIFEDAAAFLDQSQAWLETRETENNLVLGIALLLQKDPTRYKSQPVLAVVTEMGEIMNAAIMTPPHSLVLSGQALHASLKQLANGLFNQKWFPPGVIGPAQTSRAFAGLWVEKSGKHAQPTLNMRLYELTRVIQPSPIPGYLRVAELEDISLITKWVMAFQREALNHSMDLIDARQLAERLVAEGKLFFWDDSGPVSIAASARPTRNGVSVNLVYTPPKLRRKGYASACVAALSQHLLDSGFQYCCLFTDLANPTSNRIYMDIGYQPLCDFDEYRFVEFTLDQPLGGTG